MENMLVVRLGTLTASCDEAGRWSSAAVGFARMLNRAMQLVGAARFGLFDALEGFFPALTKVDGRESAVEFSTGGSSLWPA